MKKKFIETIQFSLGVIGISFNLLILKKIFEFPGYTDCSGFKVSSLIISVALLLSISISGYLLKNGRKSMLYIPFLLMIALIFLLLSRHLNLFYIYEEQMLKIPERCEIF